MKNFIKSNKHLGFNEIVFENRNKEYGAYVLRNEEGFILTKALFIGVAFFASVAIVPLVISSFQTPKTIVDESSPFVFTPVDIFEPETVEIVKPVVPQKIIQQTVKIEIPTPTRDSKNETPPPSINEIKEANIGLESTAGEPPTVLNPPVTEPILPVGPVTVSPKVDSNLPVAKVDVEANFMGGINSFRAKVVNNFNTGSFEGKGELMKTTVTFIVERDGSISNIKALGGDATFNKEAEQTIKTIKGKWLPAKLKGQNVRSYFKLPIVMQFE